ncbi:MAG: hypothetical protein K6U11_13740 [bacterium]|nr:hypothetical protein [bacterium]
MIKKVHSVFIAILINLLIVGLLRVPMAASNSLQTWAPAVGLLEGTWDCRKNRTTIFHVNNPTKNWLLVLFSFYYDDEKWAGSRLAILSPDDVVEVDARFVWPPNDPLCHIGRWGKVKIASFYPCYDEDDDNCECDGNPTCSCTKTNLKNGITGFQKEVFSSVVSISKKSAGTTYPDLPISSIYGLTEANLKVVPVPTKNCVKAEAEDEEIAAADGQDQDSDIFDLAEELNKSMNSTILADGILYDVDDHDKAALCRNLRNCSSSSLFSPSPTLAEYLRSLGITSGSAHGVDREKPVTFSLPKCSK